MKSKYMLIILFAVLIVVFFKMKSNSSKENMSIMKPVSREFFSDEVAPQKDKQLTPQKRVEDLEKLHVSRHNSITKASKMIEPAVVSINVIKTEIVRRVMNPFDNPFFGFFDYAPYRREIKSIGSGVIFNEKGYIITNAHVVEGATQIRVVIEDGREFDSEKIGEDPIHDIAILKINGSDLPVAKLGASDDLIIGEWAIAIGNPYGYLIKDNKPSVSVGVISAVNRDFAENRDGKIYRKMIQTDASINPGNSGGPLVNIYGEVIGINTFIFSETGGSIGIGFAIPIDTVKEIAEELITYGKIRDIWFGFKVQDINPMLAKYLNLKNQDGVIIAIVEPKGPADKAGLKKGDIVSKINNHVIRNSKDAELAVREIKVGDKFSISIVREGKEGEIKIEAVEHK
jgi:serine protease Do